MRGRTSRQQKAVILYLRGVTPRPSYNERVATESQGPDHEIEAREELGMTAKVTVEEVERVAELAHLELLPEETASMLHDLNAILDYVAELNVLDTTGIVPLAQVTELVDAAGSESLRADLALPSLDRTVVLSQAPQTDGVFFQVPKVIER